MIGACCQVPLVDADAEKDKLSAKNGAGARPKEEAKLQSPQGRLRAQHGFFRDLAQLP